MRAQTDWERTFRSWLTRASDTEEGRCENVTAMVEAAIRDYEPLAKLRVDIFPRGSYPANTNVRQVSDVDVVVLLRDAVQWAGPQHAGVADLKLDSGLIATVLRDLGSLFLDESTRYWEFRGLVRKALERKFDARTVSEGKKSIKIRENTYRVRADVVPCCEFRRYTGIKLPDGSWEHDLGVYLYGSGDSSRRIVNYPVQDMDNGVDKNNLTAYCYKRVVRILKSLRDEMSAAGITSANVPSFLIESLAWNVPAEVFDLDEDGYWQVVSDCLAVLNANLTAPSGKDTFTEVNGIKPLFSEDQAWTLDAAQSFVKAAQGFMEGSEDR